MKDSDRLIRDKVNSLEEIEDSYFDKDAAWTKLQMRMTVRSSSQGKRRLYYGMAAGIMLLCISIAFIMKNNKQENNVATPATVRNTPLTVVMPDTLPGTHGTHITQSAKIAPPPSQQTRNNLVKKDSDSLASVVIKTTLTEPQATQTIIKDTAEPKPAYAQRKMKVLHINDVTNEPQTFKPPQPEGFITIAEHRLYKNPAPSGHKEPSEIPRTFNTSNHYYE